MKRIIYVVGVFLCMYSEVVCAQEVKVINYPIEEVQVTPALGTPVIQASNYKLFRIQPTVLFQELEGVTYREGEINGFVGQIQLPHPDGTLHTYTVKRNQTLHPQLNAQFNQIRTYDAYATDGSGAFCKWDITPHGLHAMIMIPGQSTIFIDPYFQNDTEYYIVYRKKDFITGKQRWCDVINSSESGPKPGPTVKLSFGTCELRTYRLAVAATGEYTAFHGGTVALAQAAQATTMNRVNGVYEKDIAITMVIVPNNNSLIYTSTGSDPYTNGTPGTMINQNQTNVDNVIGSANYDIGHVFGTNSGGLAGLGVVCTGGQKARGVTGSSAPVGDPFDIDYVAHEMGHQFGGNHTQNNNCNSVSAARREPGSASTIMGYAGICAPNVQNNSDDYFHGYNLGEISIEILSTGHQCEVLTPLNNAAPTIVSTGGNISVPKSTPFVLTGNATDPNGDVLTYLWEQMDNEASTQPPVATATGGPNFRSYDPTTNPSRYFPSLSLLASNGPFTWEVLPSVARVMDFRLTVRDNHAVGSCNAYTDVTVTTVATAGPFVVTYPTAAGISWVSGSNQTVTWDVASTTASPINCANVKILLSTDGGNTYPYTLLASTPNDGTQSITVPNVNSTTCRVMVISSAETFFDISNNNFTITCANNTTPTFNAFSTYCVGETAAPLPTISNNNISGTWAPPLSTATPGTTTYTFTPAANFCASSTTASITVTNGVTPTFNTLTPVCQNAPAPILPTTSVNNITGSWSPPVSTNLVGTSSYVFTPDAGQCAVDGSISLTVNPSIVPQFTQAGPFCQGENAAALPSTSNDGISGTWSPVLNTNATGSSVYTFVPSQSGQCTQQTTMNITVSPAPNLQVNQNVMQLTSVATGVSYQWIDCETNNLVNGATSQSFTPTVISGSFAVILSNAGCTDTTECVFVDQSSLGQLDEWNITIYPNPFEDALMVSLSTHEFNECALKDATGKIISIQTCKQGQTLSFSTENLSQGMYFVVLTGNNMMQVRKVVKE